MKWLLIFVAATMALSGRNPASGAPAVVVAPVKEQFPATVELRPEKASFLLGEPIFLQFVVKNPTDSAWNLMVGGDYRNRLGRPNSFKVEVRDEAGKPVPQPDSGMGFGGLMGAQKVPAHGELALSLFMPHWATFSGAGHYRVTARRSLVWVLPGKTIFDSFNDKESARSIPAEVSAEVDVLPPDFQKMGAQIQELGEAVLSKSGAYSDAAAMKLRAIHDARVVPFLIRAVSRPEPFDSDIYALSNFDDDAAFETLETLATNMKFKGVDRSSVPGFIAGTTDSTRLAAARAIAHSQSAWRTEFLVSLLRDPYYAVRLTVVQNIGGLPVPSARAVWRAMLSDPNADVRSEAKRYLEQSKAKK